MIYKKGTLTRLVAMFILAAMLLPLMQTDTARAAGEAIVSSNIQSLPGNDTYVTGLQISGTGNEEVSLRAEVSSGYFDFDNTTDVDIDWANDSRVFTIKGLRDDVNAALTTLYFVGTNELYTVELTLVDGNYNSDNGHIYQVIANSGITWADAKTAAEGMTNGGVNGYLATITSQDEYDFIRERINDSGWIGASDSATEGEWRWVTGPEAGEQFWAGDGGTGSPYNGAFSSWNPSEPNNSGPGENCGQIASGAQWNDLDCASTENEYYVVEFGGAGALPQVTQSSFTIDLRGDSSVIQISSCDQLFELGPESVANTIELVADIDCQGRTEAPMFDEEDFYGIFEGNGFKIKNLIIANDDNDHVGLTGYGVGATYKNIFLDNITLNGGFHNGVLAGHVEESIIAENVHATNINMNSVPGEDVDEMGVLFGEVELEYEYGPSRIEHVSVQGTFTISDVENVYSVGGIAGYVDAEGDFVMKQVYADVDIVINNISGSTTDVGGLVGNWEVNGEDKNPDKDVAHSITDSYSWGTITAPGGTNIGGIIGNLVNDNEDNADMSFTINNSYSWMGIDAASSVGGLIGNVDQIDTASLGGQVGEYSFGIKNSFYAGTLNGDSDTGIIIGVYGDFEEEYSTLSFDNNWYDSDKVGSYDCVSNMPINECNEANVGGSNPNYFINNKTSAPMDEWDFSTIWRAQTGTPPVFKPFIGNDADQDDVNNYVESRAPNNGDANNDGIVDSVQSKISSLVSPVNNKYVSLESSVCSANTGVSIAPEATSANDKDSAYRYPAGLLSFTLTGCGTGATETVTQYYYGKYDTDAIVVRKYDSLKSTYTTISSATVERVTIGGKNAVRVTYNITDGGILDQDGVANGTIVDPVGLAVAVTITPTTDNDSSTLSAPNTGFQQVSTVSMVVALVVGAVIALVGAVKIYGKKRYQNIS